MDLRPVLMSVLVIGCVRADCLDAWTRFGDSCYHHGHTDHSFQDASRYCRHYGAELVNIETKLENDFIRSYLSDLIYPKHWIGCTDELIEGVWKLYPSETTASFRDFAHGEPNQGKGANCAAIWKSYGYHWVDEPCGHSFKALCEMPAEREQPIVG